MKDRQDNRLLQQTSIPRTDLQLVMLIIKIPGRKRRIAQAASPESCGSSVVQILHQRVIASSCVHRNPFQRAFMGRPPGSPLSILTAEDKQPNPALLAGIDQEPCLPAADPRSLQAGLFSSSRLRRGKRIFAPLNMPANSVIAVGPQALGWRTFDQQHGSPRVIKISVRGIIM